MTRVRKNVTAQRRAKAERFARSLDADLRRLRAYLNRLLNMITPYHPIGWDGLFDRAEAAVHRCHLGALLWRELGRIERMRREYAGGYLMPIETAKGTVRDLVHRAERILGIQVKRPQMRRRR